MRSSSEEDERHRLWAAEARRERDAACQERDAALQERDDVVTGDSFKDLYLTLQGQLIQLRQELEETKCQESVFT